MVTSIIRRLIPLGVICSIWIVSSCSHFDGEHLFAFPIRSVRFPSEIDTLCAEPISEALFDLTAFCIIDSTRILESSLRSSSGFLFSVRDIKTGTNLFSLCRYGRGPGEFQAVSGWTDIHDKKMTALDPSTMKYYEIDIDRSQMEGEMVCSRAIQLERDNITPFSPFPVFTLKDEMIAYVAPNSGETPRYLIYDLTNGEVIKEFRPYSELSNNKIKRKISESNYFQCFQAIKPDRSRICAAFPKTPRLVILDTENGNTTGVQIKKPLGGPLKDKGFYFRDVAVNDSYIYALFTGNEEKRGKTYICVFNWAGEFLSCFLLDQIYYQLRLSGDRLYLTADYIIDQRLYSIRLSSLKTINNGK